MSFTGSREEFERKLQEGTRKIINDFDKNSCYSERRSNHYLPNTICALYYRTMTGRGGPGSIPGQFMWDLWCTKWHWDRIFSSTGLPLSISFNLCSITSKNEKRIIFITALHNKPHGCGASVAYAAGPFTTKKRTVTHL